MPVLVVTRRLMTKLPNLITRVSVKLLTLKLIITYRSVSTLIYTYPYSKELATREEAQTFLFASNANACRPQPSAPRCLSHK